MMAKVMMITVKMMAMMTMTTRMTMTLTRITFLGPEGRRPELKRRRSAPNQCSHSAQWTLTDFYSNTHTEIHDIIQVHIHAHMAVGNCKIQMYYRSLGDPSLSGLTLMTFGSFVGMFIFSCRNCDLGPNE